MAKQVKKGFGKQPPQHDVNQLFATAVSYHQKQLFEQALIAYQQVLNLQPNRIEALINLGSIYKNLGKISEAINCYRQALKLNSNSGELWYNFGNTLQTQGNFDEAINAYRQAIKLSPNLAAAYFNLAKLLQEQENYTEAAEYYQHTIQLQPNLARAYTNLGNTLKALDKLDEAISAHNKAIEIQPNYAEAYYNLGNAFKAKKQYPEAIKAYNFSLQLNPNFTEAQLNLASTYEILEENEKAENILKKLILQNSNSKSAHLSLGKLLHKRKKYSTAESHYRYCLQLENEDKEALEALINIWQIQRKYEEAISFLKSEINSRPSNSLPYYYLGSIYNEMGRYNDSIPALRQAIQLDSKLANAYNNLGYALSQVSQLSEAINACEEALKINPELVAAWVNKGYALNNQGCVKEAGECFREVVKLEPNYYVGHSNLLYSLNYDSTHTPETIANAHRQWGEDFAANITPPKTYQNVRDPNRKLRIGYVSPDFRQHSVAYFIEPILQHHNKQEFEIFGYANVSLPDAVTQRLQNLTDNWCDVSQLSDDNLSEKIQEDGIDILIDLAGHTGNNRLLTFLRKPAPVQLTYLGYPNTTGTDRIDYRITDNWADPAGLTDAYYSEELIRLPRCFLCYQPSPTAPPVSELPAKIINRITFGSFNNLPKITPEVIALWSQILHSVPNSRIILKIRWFDDEKTRQRYLTMFAENGIENERIKLIGLIPDSSHHLAFYGNIDIALDPFPYHGTTTTCEALWMGVPVISLAGNTHASRVGVSLLSSVEMSELIATTKEEYLTKAVNLARDLNKLSELRSQMRQRLASSPLCDPISHTKIMEETYRQLWKKYCLSFPE